MIIGIPEKVNFTRLSRYGGRTAKTFVSNFKTSMDWRKVNIGMARDCFGSDDDIAVTIDPSFISKAGKLTYGIGRYLASTIISTYRKNASTIANVFPFLRGLPVITVIFIS